MSSIKCIGGTVTEEFGYVYHTFVETGTFICQENTTVNILIVAQGVSYGAGDKMLTQLELMKDNEYVCVIGDHRASFTGPSINEVCVGHKVDEPGINCNSRGIVINYPTGLV